MDQFHYFFFCYELNGTILLGDAKIPQAARQVALSILLTHQEPKQTRAR